MQRLGSVLRVSPSELGVLARFAETDIERLNDAVVAAIEAQRRDLDNALERALGFVPALLRGRARKLLFPEGPRG
jgi:hypothetical protein